MKNRRYPGKLHHRPPSWVPDASIYHVRIRIAKNSQALLTEDALGRDILDSFAFYADRGKWSCCLVVILPDHLHAMLSFGKTVSMSRVVGEWKSFHARKNGVQWQDNFFDHRIRSSEEYRRQYCYILNNPVASGLVDRSEDWPWVGAFCPAESIPHF